MTSPAPGLHEQKQIGGAFAFLFRVIARQLTRTGRQRMTGVAGQPHRAFVKTHLGIAWIIGIGVQVQNILQMPDIVGTHTGNAPFLKLPGFDVVFLSTRPTILEEIVSICSSSRSIFSMTGF